MAPQRPLSGLLVLDLTQMASGPFATMMLADFGADVIKIERPRGGDPSRSLPPFARDASGQTIAAGILRFGRNKRSLALDLNVTDGKEIFCALARQADVVWENFVPGTMEKLGLGYDVLAADNPGLVYASISGFGRGDSPESSRTALDIVAQAASGLMEVSGEPGGPPAQAGAVIGDLVPGLYGVIGTLLALRQRDQTGRGSTVDVAMVDALVAMNERALLLTSLTGEEVTRGRLGHAGPYGRFPTSDGEIVVGASIPSLWERLCRAIGREDLIDEAPAPDERGRWWHFGQVMDAPLRAWAAEHTTADALRVLRLYAVPAERVMKPGEVLQSPHVAARHLLLENDHSVAGHFQSVGSPIKMSASPEPTPGPVPDLGADSRAVLRQWLDYDDRRLDDLERRGVIGIASQ